jgi:hypothetical protein
VSATEVDATVPSASTAELEGVSGELPGEKKEKKGFTKRLKGFFASKKSDTEVPSAGVDVTPPDVEVQSAPEATGADLPRAEGTADVPEAKPNAPEKDTAMLAGIGAAAAGLVAVPAAAVGLAKVEGEKSEKTPVGVTMPEVEAGGAAAMSSEHVCIVYLSSLV